MIMNGSWRHKSSQLTGQYRFESIMTFRESAKRNPQQTMEVTAAFSKDSDDID